MTIGQFQRGMVTYFAEDSIFGLLTCDIHKNTKLLIGFKSMAKR